MTYLSISIVNYNTKNLLKNCLNSVFQNTKDISFEVFVVDNASQDDSVEMVRHEFPEVKLIENEKNIGFSAANNLAIAQARGRYFVLLNSDTEVQRKALTKLVQFMEETPDCGISCPQLLYPDGRLQVSYMPFRYPKQRAMWEINPRLRDIVSIMKYIGLWKLSLSKQPPSSENQYTRVPIEVERPRGACFLVRKRAIEQVGPMDERFFLYCEEVDWAWRMRKAGWKRYFVPDARVIHIWGASTSVRSELMDLIHTQSDYKYYFKHFGWRGLIFLRAGYAVGASLALLLGIYALLFGWLGLNNFKARDQFEVARNLSKKLFLFKELRPTD